MELRTTPASECRVVTRADGGKTAVGYGAVFFNESDPGTEYKLGRSIVERIDKGAFTDALSRPDDVRGLLNHEPDNILGRTTAGTTRLSVDSKGLKYEIDLPDTQLGRDVATLIERGDLSGSSFAFTVDPEGQAWETKDGIDVRTINSVTLFDVGPVTYPAYDSTTTALRSVSDAAEAVNSRDKWKSDSAKTRRDKIIKKNRARLLDIE